MRSILKSRRKSDSSIHDLSPPGDLVPRKPQSRLEKEPHSTKPSLSTPQPNPLQMTPPQNVVPGQQSSVSSPKKLLTPIKKMFGHHRQNTPSAAGDTLNNILYGDFEPPKGRKEFKRNHQSFSNLSDLNGYTHMESPLSADSLSSKTASSEDTKLSSKPVLQQAPLCQETSQVKLVLREPPATKLKQVFTPQSAGAPTTAESSDHLSMGSSPNEDQDHSDCSSQFSFEKGIRGGRNTSVKYYKTKSETAPNSAVSTSFLNMDDMGFEEDVMTDYDFENNGMSDDDAYGEDFDEENPEVSNRYGDFLSEETDSMSRDFEMEALSDSKSDDDETFPRDTLSMREAHTAPASHSQSPKTPIFPGTAAIPVLAGENAKSSSEFFETAAKSPGYGDDFLDSYLDREKSPSDSLPATPIEQSSISKNVSHQSESVSSSCYSGGFNRKNNRATSSPESERGTKESNTGLGIDFGESTEARDGVDKPSNRLSILNMMDTLLKIDGQADDDLPCLSAPSLNGAITSSSDTDNAARIDVGKSDEEVGEPLPAREPPKLQEDPSKKTEIRRSLIDMMNTLSRLDNDLEKESNEDALKVTKKDVRKSIADMMSALNSLESQAKSEEQLKQEKPETKISESHKTPNLQSSKRYSWFSGEGNSERHEPSSFSTYEESSHEGQSLQLNQDILDEINSIPEDYDFSETPAYEHGDSRAFLRSNSFKNKPQKVAQDYNIQNNKLHLSHKTVTFYKTSYDAVDSLKASRSPTRISSMRSTSSLNSIDDKETHGSEENSKTEGRPEKSSSLHNYSNTSGESSVSPQKMSSLEPIVEAHTPHLT